MKSNPGTQFRENPRLGAIRQLPAKEESLTNAAVDDRGRMVKSVNGTQRGRHLGAAIELISPANKDRPEIRRQFVAKCAELLRQHVSIVLVDLVTVRDINLYTEMLGWIGEEQELQKHRSSIDVRSFPLVATSRLETLAGIMEPSAHHWRPTANFAALAQRRTRNPARS